MFFTALQRLCLFGQRQDIGGQDVVVDERRCKVISEVVFTVLVRLINGVSSAILVERLFGRINMPRIRPNQ